MFALKNKLLAQVSFQKNYSVNFGLKLEQNFKQFLKLP